MEYTDFIQNIHLSIAFKTQQALEVSSPTFLWLNKKILCLFNVYSKIEAVQV